MRKTILIGLFILCILLVGCGQEMAPVEEPIEQEKAETATEVSIEVTAPEVEEEEAEEPKEIKVIEPKIPKLVVVRKDIREAKYDINYITGEVKNEGTATANNVKVIATLYDADGNLLHTSENLVLDPKLSPGERSTFKIPYDERDYPDVADYEVTVVRG
jgi:PBP1b-binding outer membrane lipoprotein LpoB